MKLDTNLGGKIHHTEVFNDNKKNIQPKFKREAADLVLQQSYSYPQACEAMGVGETALRRWVSQLSAERSGITPKAKALTPNQLASP